MKSERDQIQQRITNAMTQLSRREAAPLVRHFAFTREGTDIRVGCWCGKATLLQTNAINVFVRRLGEWTYAHEECEPKDSR